MVRFGDGSRGRVPPAGARVAVTYRPGAGAGTAGGVLPGRLERPNFFPGKLLTAEDLQAEQDYHRDRQRRHNLLLHGTGVVCGLRVGVEEGGIAVSPGMALDSSGNEIIVDAPELVPFPPGRSPVSFAISLSETPVRPVPAPGDGAGEEMTIHSRMREGFEFHYLAPAGCEPHQVLLARLLHRGGRWTMRGNRRQSRRERLFLGISLLALGAVLLPWPRRD